MHKSVPRIEKKRNRTRTTATTEPTTTATSPPPPAVEHVIGVGQRKQTALERPPTIADVRRFPILGPPDAPLWPATVPAYVKMSATAIEMLGGGAEAQIALWGLHRGLQRLDKWPDIQRLRADRAALVALGNPTLENWQHTISNPAGTTSRFSLRSANPDDVKAGHEMWQGLGLPRWSILAALALMLAFVDVPGLAPELVRQQHAALKEFRRALRERVLFGETKLEVLKKSPPAQPYTVRFVDMLQDEED